MAARRSRTIPVTPQAVSNGSLSRKAYAFTCAAHVMNTATATATSTSSTHRPMPAAAFSEIAAPGRSLSAASKSSAAGESNAQQRRQRELRRGRLPQRQIVRRLLHGHARSGAADSAGAGSGSPSSSFNK